MISLSPSDRPGKARTKRTDQQGYEGPKQRMRESFARGVCRCLGAHKGFRYSLVRIALANAAFRHHHLIQVLSVIIGHIPPLEGECKDGRRFATRFSIIYF